MPLADTTQAAALTFDAAVARALARRLSDTPYPHNAVAAQPPVDERAGASDTASGATPATAAE